MKKYITAAFLAVLLSLPTLRAQSDSWYADKYSMFIHFGLYSHFGGVWNGNPVRQGYSEQIQSFAGIFSDWYAEEAYGFDPVNFDADAIARLAKAGGMRSIVFTSKHHDGFCMFDTQTTKYSSVCMMPSHRDFVREMSDACRRHGLRFGLYYSLIDWNYPHAYPISSHNADFVTPEHHEFSKAQVRELLTNYGEVSELWFDMGSLEPWQSKELYDLVKELQPDCMVSGRLGNDSYDFAVMHDNKLPENALHAPWQTAASMFNETWSYRSWQERGRVEDKYAEKLRSLIEIVSHGGNYLLNIGPASDGSVVPFEDEVIRSMGKWLEQNGDAIYGTQPSPFRTTSGGFEWGYVTVKDNMMYLLLSGEYPEIGLSLPVAEGLVGIEGADYEIYGGMCTIDVTPEMFGKPDVKVIRLTYDRPVKDLFRFNGGIGDDLLTWKNALPDHSYSCFDYYSNYRSTVGYGWDVMLQRPVSAVELTYTSEEIGRQVKVAVGDAEVEVTLTDDLSADLKTYVDMDNLQYGRMRGGVFDNAADVARVPQWVPMESDSMELPSTGFENYLMTADVYAGKSCTAILDVRAGNGVEVMVDGKTMMKHLNPYRTTDRTEKVMLELHKGVNKVLVRSFNRFEETVCAGMSVAQEQKVYKVRAVLPSTVSKGLVHVGIQPLDRLSPHTDSELHNVTVRLMR
jgi:alpha-L-fucosidase